MGRMFGTDGVRGIANIELTAKLPQVLVNAKVPNEKKNIYLEDEEIINAINEVEAKLNGVGRVLIRPSGTEPVRVMLEGENQEEINEMAKILVELILSKI